MSSIPEENPKRERRKEARPSELLDAALELFVDKGFAATRVEEVAARAGVSKGTLFLYFPSKEELFKAVVRQTIAGRLPEWNDEFEKFEGSTPELVRYGMFSWWERIGATRASGLPKLILSEARNFPDIAAFYEHEVVRPTRDLMRRILQRGIDRGEFRADLDLDYAFYSLLAPLVFMAMMKHCPGTWSPQSSPIDPQRYLTQQVDTILRGICEPAAAHSEQKK